MIEIKDEKRQNVPSMKSLTPTERSLMTIGNLLKKWGYQPRKGISRIGPVGGLVKMGVKPAREGGFKPGKHGCVRISTGKWLEMPITKNEAGVALPPPLKGRDWHLIDDEIDSKNYHNPRKIFFKPEDEEYWFQVLIQGQASLECSPFEHTLTRLTRLKLQKPTQTMDPQATSVFLEDICDPLEQREYSYPAIDEGITRLIELEDDKFFPTIKVLIKYIHPVHWQLKRRISKLEEILKRNHREIIQPVNIKE